MGLATTFRGRLAPSECYPANEPGLTVRIVPLGGGDHARVVEAGPAGRVPVLLVHGWGCSVYHYRKLIPALVAAGRRVVAIDLRGHGGSGKPVDVQRYTAVAMADFLARLLDALDLGRMHAVAHSLGAGVTIDVAARTPSRFASLTLLAPVGLATVRFTALARLVTPRVAAPLVPYAVPRWSVPLVLRAVYGRAGRYAGRDVDEYWAPTADPHFALALHALLHRYDFGARPDGHFEAPVPRLVLLGGRDLLVRSRQSHERARRLPGTRVRLFERAGHVLAEEVPGDVMAELLPHLARNS